MRAVIAFVLALLASTAHAQTPEPCPCAWWQDDADYYALIVSQNLVGGPGPWVRWQCYPQRIPPGSTHAPDPIGCTLAAPWSAIDLRRLGDRLDTIRKAPDWKTAARTAWKRYVTLPLSDPSLAEVRAAIAAAEAPASQASAP